MGIINNEGFQHITLSNAMGLIDSAPVGSRLFD